MPRTFALVIAGVLSACAGPALPESVVPGSPLSTKAAEAPRAEPASVLSSADPLGRVVDGGAPDPSDEDSAPSQPDAARPTGHEHHHGYHHHHRSPATDAAAPGRE